MTLKSNAKKKKKCVAGKREREKKKVLCAQSSQMEPQ